jgi:protease-4
MRPLFALLRNLFVNLGRLVHRLLLAHHRIDFVRIELKGEIPVRRARRRVPFFLRRLVPRPPALSFEELDEILRRIAEDRRLRGLLLVVRRLRGGWGQLVALRARLTRLREAGKEVAVWIEEAGNREYYLASAGSLLALAPAGHVGLVGLAAEVRFFKSALEKVSAEAEVVAAGRYKTAFDPFTRNEMTPAHREAVEAILDDLSTEMVRAIALGRELDEERVRRLVDEGPFNPPRAREAGLVDVVCYEDELHKRLGEKARVAPLARWARAARRRYDWAPLWRRRVVGFVDVSGLIHAGESSRAPGRATAGHETVCQALEAARKDRRVAAVLLHVSSRGGSGLASDLIWREVRRLRDEKPVVAYLGDVAASGGYYVACGAHHVVASAGTLTGSIGVLAAKLNLGRLLDRLGVRTEVLRRGKSADWSSPARGLTEIERERLAADVGVFYEDFVAKVAESRGLARERVAEAAEGRVWTGARALGLGLVDELGDFALALTRARERAGLGAQVPLVTVGREPPMRGLAGVLPWPVGEVAGALGELTLLQGDRWLCLPPFDVEVR